MIRGKFGQARCSACGSWHFAIQLDDNLNPTEYKCCKCQRLIQAKHYVVVEDDKNKISGNDKKTKR